MILQIDSGLGETGFGDPHEPVLNLVRDDCFLHVSLPSVGRSSMLIYPFFLRGCVLRADVHRPRGMSSFWSSTRVFKVSC